MKLQEFFRLQNWPKLARTFQKLVQKTPDDSSEFRSFPNPVFALMYMAARNGLATKYLAIEENFLLAAIHIAALKNFPFAEGVLPDLPGNMPSVPPGWVVFSFCAPKLTRVNLNSGFKDKESYEQFEADFNAFVGKSQVEGIISSAANVASRSPFQLAVMISPLYLLVTRRLSTKSFHRRTVIDLAARLGPHKPPRVLAVESAIWDAIFRLAEGRVSVHTVLRDLAKSLPWSDIDMASNCDSDLQWFSPKTCMFLAPCQKLITHPMTLYTTVTAMQYDPALSLVQGGSLNPSTNESRFVIKPKSFDLSNDDIFILFFRLQCPGGQHATFTCYT